MMMSRATSLDGVLILRPFSKTKICCRQSGDICKEVNRLNILKLKTTAEFGTDAEGTTAQLQLRDLGAELHFDAEGRVDPVMAENNVECRMIVNWQ